MKAFPQNRRSLEDRSQRRVESLASSADVAEDLWIDVHERGEGYHHKTSSERYTATNTDQAPRPTPAGRKHRDVGENGTNRKPVRMPLEVTAVNDYLTQLLRRTWSGHQGQA